MYYLHLHHNRRISTVRSSVSSELRKSLTRVFNLPKFVEELLPGETPEALAMRRMDWVKATHHLVDRCLVSEEMFMSILRPALVPIKEHVPSKCVLLCVCVLLTFPPHPRQFPPLQVFIKVTLARTSFLRSVSLNR